MRAARSTLRAALLLPAPYLPSVGWGALTPPPDNAPHYILQKKCHCEPVTDVTDSQYVLPTHRTLCNAFVGGGVPDDPPTTHRASTKSLSLRGA